MYITKGWRHFGIAAAAGAIVLTGLAAGGAAQAQAATGFTLYLNGGGNVTVGCTPGNARVLTASQARREYAATNNCGNTVVLFSALNDPEASVAIRPHSTADIERAYTQFLVA